MVPSVIWSLWLDGRENAPKIPSIAFKAWEELNPKFELRILDKLDVQQLLKDYPSHVLDLPSAALSDIVRIELLGENGGVWVDSTVCPTRALEDWIHQLSTSGFFAFSLSDPMRPIASWFLAADSGSPLIQTWRQHVRRYWQRSRQLTMDPRDGNPFVVDAMAHVHPSTADQYAKFPYFWFHHLFAYLLNNDGAFLSAWEKVPRISGMPPQFFRLELEQRPDTLSTEIAEKLLGQSPLHKMDWRMSLTQQMEATLLHQINSSKELILRQSA